MTTLQLLRATASTGRYCWGAY